MNYLKYLNTLYLINFLSIYLIFLFAKWEDIFHRLSKIPEHKASIHKKVNGIITITIATTEL